MKKYFVLKVKDENAAATERVILTCLVDRMKICSLIKSIKLHKDKHNTYFVVGGELCSCQRVLPIVKRILVDRNIDVRIYSYDSFRANYMDFDNLLWYSSSNSEGKTVKNYHNNPLIINYMKKLTTNYILKRGLFSNHIFCSKCKEGIADPVELSSIEGIYKCSFCGAETKLKGPLLEENTPVTHLSVDEQLYLIGLASMSRTEIAEEDVYKGEQMSIVLAHIPVIEVTPRPRKKRTIVLDESEQLSWDFL